MPFLLRQSSSSLQPPSKQYGDSVGLEVGGAVVGAGVGLGVGDGVGSLVGLLVGLRVGRRSEQSPASASSDGASVPASDSESAPPSGMGWDRTSIPRTAPYTSTGTGPSARRCPRRCTRPRPTWSSRRCRGTRTAAPGEICTPDRPGSSATSRGSRHRRSSDSTTALRRARRWGIPWADRWESSTDLPTEPWRGRP